MEEDSTLRDFEREESCNPSPRKLDGERVIYISRQLGAIKSPGAPVLCDFGEARDGTFENEDDIQPEVYRAPEVVLEMKWSYSVDIWNVGVMVNPLRISKKAKTSPDLLQIWDLFENKHMFDGIHPESKKYKNECHLAEMVAYLGPPPLDFLQRPGAALEYFDEFGE